MHPIIVGPWPLINIGSIQLPTYFVLLSLIFTVMILWAYQRADRFALSITTTTDVFMISLLTGGIGARLLHVFYESSAYYMANPWAVFYIWQGGFVYWGGFIGAFIGGALTLAHKKESFRLWLDFFTPVMILGYALGRCVCFLVGCCYGKICDLPWAYKFTQLHPLQGTSTLSARHPTQIYTAVIELVILVFILRIENKKYLQHKAGQLFAFWLILHSLNRLFMELLRDDDRGQPLIWNEYSLSISSVVCLIMILLASAFLYKEKNRPS